MAPAYIPVELRRLVRADAGARCGYYHTPEAYIGMPLEYDHLYPEALGGPTERKNLWQDCTRCNDFKGDRISGHDPETGEELSLFNPRTQRWAEHFAWSASGTHILSLTPLGRATVAALRLNNDVIVVTRQFWVAVGWWPPAEDR
ncbi:MAG: HNH endonuclease [Oscillochloridaceae bacterium umkhey_bin13]